MVNNVKKTGTECCDDGRAFDLGINPSSIAHVDMWFGRAGTNQHDKEEVHDALIRIHLTFGDDFTTPGQICRKDPAKRGLGVRFLIGCGDEIRKVTIWSGDYFVYGIQFHTANGIVSPIYGEMQNVSKTTEICLAQDETILGAYGRWTQYPVALSAVGFTTGKVHSAQDNTKATAA